MVFKDVYNLLYILSQHNGGRLDLMNEDEEDIDLNIKVMEEVRLEVIKMYLEIKRKSLGKPTTQEE